MIRNRKAFTLIELLVVIAIISILATILMPSLGKAQELARDASCKSNQHGIGLALQLHANDHNGRLPQAHNPNEPWDTDTWNDRWFGQLHLEYETDKGMFQCASAKELDEQTILPAWLQGYPPHPGFTAYSLSYGYNYFYIQFSGDKSKWGIWTTKSVSASDFQSPGASIAITDTHPKEGLGGMSYFVKAIQDANMGSAYDEWFPPHLRHNERTNALMLDGHVTSLIEEEVRTEELFDME